MVFKLVKKKIPNILLQSMIPGLLFSVRALEEYV